MYSFSLAQNLLVHFEKKEKTEMSALTVVVHSADAPPEPVPKRWEALTANIVIIISALLTVALEMALAIGHTMWSDPSKIGLLVGWILCTILTIAIYIISVRKNIYLLGLLPHQLEDGLCWYILFDIVFMFLALALSGYINFEITMIVLVIVVAVCLTVCCCCCSKR